MGLQLGRPTSELGDSERSSVCARAVAAVIPARIKSAGLGRTSYGTRRADEPWAVERCHAATDGLSGSRRRLDFGRHPRAMAE